MSNILKNKWDGEIGFYLGRGAICLSTMENNKLPWSVFCWQFDLILHYLSAEATQNY